MVIVVMSVLPSCSSYHYQRFEEGVFEGTLVLKWIRPNRFIYEPDPDNPLTFTRADGQAITPGRMPTDGGSIPRLLWSIPPYSPWGYAPGYIIHDWVFNAHRCGDETFTFEESALILGDAIKTLMENGCAPRNKFGAYTIFEAVRTPFARSAWEDGNCQIDTLSMADVEEAEVIAVISFDSTSPQALSNAQGECTF
ncbi:MAG: hypothetical protein P8Y01_00615 [Woeseiaceae bacterium]